MTNFQSYLDISYDEQSSMNERQLLRNWRKELSGFKKLFFKRIHPKKNVDFALKLIDYTS